MRMIYAAVVAGLASSLMPAAAQAAYIINVTQVGDNVVAVGNGSLDLAGLSLGPTQQGDTFISPHESAIVIGEGLQSQYNGAVGPSSFGIGFTTFADLFSGGEVGVYQSTVIVPGGYRSGTPLGISTATWLNSTFASLGAVEGSYVYEWNGDRVMLNIGLSPVPLPASAPMFGAALLGLAGISYVAKRKKAAAAG